MGFGGVDQCSVGPIQMTMRRFGVMTMRRFGVTAPMWNISSLSQVKDLLGGVSEFCGRPLVHSGSETAVFARAISRAQVVKCDCVERMPQTQFMNSRMSSLVVLFLKAGLE